jgi:hypothetical protein
MNCGSFSTSGILAEKSAFFHQRVSRKDYFMAQNSQRNSRKNRAAHLEKFKFQPGQSGNPGGRPKKICTDALVRQLNKRASPNDPKDDRLMVDVWAEKLLMLALGPDPEVRALIEVADRIEGKSGQSVTLGGDPDGTPINVANLTPEQNDALIAGFLAKMRGAKDGKRSSR